MSAVIKSKLDYPGIAEEDSIFNEALMKPSLQVSQLLPAASGR